MSISFGEKIKLIRSSLGLSQSKFADLVGIPLSSVKNYDGGTEVGSAALKKIATHPECNKYALWLISDAVNPDMGQIAPGDVEQSPDNNTLSQSQFDDEFCKTIEDSLLMFCHLGWLTPNFSKDDKIGFDTCSSLILKDVRSLLNSMPQQTNQPSLTEKTG